MAPLRPAPCAPSKRSHEVGADPPPPRAILQVLAALKKAEDQANKLLLPAYKLMQLHLPDPSTQMILFAPVKSNIVEACGQLQTHVNALELPPQKRSLLQLHRLDSLAGAAA